MTRPARYCAPIDNSVAGIREICRRLATLVQCMETNINTAVVSGQITIDVQRFNTALQTKLQSEGWTLSYDGGPRLKVRPPGHPNPFPLRVQRNPNGTLTRPPKQ